MSRAPAAPKPAVDPEWVEREIDVEVEHSLAIGSRHGLVVGLVVSVLLAAAGALGLQRATGVPLALSAAAVVFMAGMHRAARRRSLSRPRLRLAMLVFVSFPTFGFIGAAAVLPFGMSSFVLGAFQVAYMYFVALSALLLDVRLSRRCGVFAAAQMLVCVAIAMPSLTATLHTTDPVLWQDVTSPGIWLIKSALVVATGFLAGELGQMARRLTVRAITDERDKRSLSRLFGQFVSPEVREHLIGQAANLKGERVRVAVLFADLRSFTTLTETTDPQEVFDDLNTYFDAMVGPISRNGGVVDKFIGDAVMAVFGGLAELDNPPAHALRAAHAMRQALADLNRQRAAAGKAAWEHGIGLDYGEVLQGPVGSSERKDFTVIGDTVNTAARLEPATKSLGQAIAMSKQFYSALPADLQTRCTAQGSLTIKGKAVPLEVFTAAD